jgi:5-methylthioadenosine/S-adenosylhomocysteine deaminase
MDQKIPSGQLSQAKDPTAKSSRKGDLQLKALKARWVLPVVGPPMENACVLIEKGKIVEVKKTSQLEPGLRNCPVSDYGEAIIMPGLINLHSHIEYSSLPPIRADLKFFPWVRALMESTASFQPHDYLSSARVGVQKAVASGTSFLVDSSYSGQAAIAISEAGLKGLIGLELFGIDDSHVERIWSDWLLKLASLSKCNNAEFTSAIEKGRLSLTVAPHAPYTVSPALWFKAKSWAAANRQIILTHLCESRQECLWFNDKNEEVDAHLKFAFGKAKYAQYGERSLADILSWKEPGLTPVEHLKRHDLLGHNLLAAHVVNVNQSDLETLSLDRVAIAHCPRSNLHLDNGEAPLAKMLDLGLSVGMGTDSLASCPNLSLIDEARFAVNLHKHAFRDSGFTARRAIEMITVEPAKCLQMADTIGSIEPGKSADLAIFCLSNKVRQAVPDDPCENLIYADKPACERLLELFVDGLSVYQRNGKGALLSEESHALL